MYACAVGYEIQIALTDRLGRGGGGEMWTQAEPVGGRKNKGMKLYKLVCVCVCCIDALVASQCMHVYEISPVK